MTPSKEGRDAGVSVAEIRGNLLKWIEDLETTDARQGRGALRSLADEYCCLGRACEVVGWGWARGSRSFSVLLPADYAGHLTPHDSGLSLAAQRMLGITDADALVDKGWHRHVGPFNEAHGQFLVMDAAVSRRVSENRWEKFDPSETMSDAFLVVEAMRAKGWFFACNNEASIQGKQWSAWFSRDLVEIVWMESERDNADALPLAIARVALKAIESIAPKSAVPETETPVSPASL